ncbi:hypothetical protein PRIPAC_75096 [Pristionchus pacificus]|uniref:Uncharacterized protein n=1 Tax=Pristionchus pacificus TaxID=54126 RepID=A0A2A6C6T2_PRIPA|nr:hypothetical protein PRIPAC_75096 [Pristionchus pacificus]|eukprot:PDM73827.1 hypothetical protein PRIPAC_41183 [Pristionchus pacificus]
MAPNCSATSSSHSFDDVAHEEKPLQATTAEAAEPYVLSEADQKYMEQLKKFEEEKYKLKLEMIEVDELVSKKFPDLPIARDVKSDPVWRYDDEQRMRVRVGLKMMNKKAIKMYSEALAFEKDLLSDIDRRIRLITAGIAALEVNRKLESRKRAVDASNDGNDEAKRAKVE